jgi:hypothetical protein
MTTQYSRNIKTLFKRSQTVKSVKHIDMSGELHGEQREWWDRHHLFPKEISVYDHGILVRSTKWYLNGQLESSVVVIGRTKREIGFYSSGTQKYKKTYLLHTEENLSVNKKWLRHGIWYGYYRNGFKYYAEKYNFSSLLSRIRFFPNGNVITKFSLEKSSLSSSESEESEDTEDTEESSIELTEKIFEENDPIIRLPYKNI